MKKFAVLFSGLILTGAAVAQDDDPMPVPFPFPIEFLSIAHTTYMTGIPEGEGRLIREEHYINNKFQTGSYRCTPNMTFIMGYAISINDDPYYKEFQTKYSICQDETLTDCREILTDSYTISKNAEGELEMDVPEVTVDVSPFASSYKSCEEHYIAQPKKLMYIGKPKKA